MAMESTELRWFFSGSPSEEMRRWLAGKADSDHVKSEQRVDVYYRAFNESQVGLKLRSTASLELKVEVNSLGPLDLRGTSGGVVGRGIAQRWKKWDLRPVPGPSLDFPGETRIEVHKTRLCCLFDLGQNPPEQVRINRGDFPFVQRGLTLELTEVGIRDELWTSVALEAFPWFENDHIELCAMSASLLRDFPEPLTEAGSFSYTQWLLRN